MKIFRLVRTDDGEHRFSFNAKDIEEAIKMKNRWCHYHSFCISSYKVEETTDTKWMHNDYIKE